MRWKKCLLAMLLLWLGAVLAWHAAPGLVEIPAQLNQPIPADIEYLDRHGRSLRRVPHTPGEFRSPTWQLPMNLVRAIVAAEDQRFFQHDGVDKLALARAAIFRHGGASTITQQLIKTALPNSRRTLANKLRIMLAARRVEKQWSKERILLEFLSRTDFGNRQIGCERAAHFYFAKSAAELGIEEAALLAGLIHAPTRLNPHINPTAAMQRQRTILRRMQLHDAQPSTLALAQPGRDWHAPHFVDMLLSAAEGTSAPQSTTLDLPLQQFAESVLSTRLAMLAQENVRDGAVVILENATGHVLALCGSPDYSRPGNGQVNGALASRSSGSTLKPFIYAMAFEQGDTDLSMVEDAPTVFATSTGMYLPVNYNRKNHGAVTYRHALGNSLNISAVKVLDRIGGPKVLRQRLRACGLSTLRETAEHYGPGLAIGNGGVRLLELANAYATLARGGMHLPVQTLTPASAGQGIRRFASHAVELVTDILSDNTARSDTFGWHSPLHLPFAVAAKTGTSTDYRDNWCMGYTPEYTVGVWVGNFDGSPMKNVSGVTGAGPIFHELFLHLAKEYGVTPFRDFKLQHASQAASAPVKIVWPQAGARLLLDADLPGGGRVLYPRLSRDVCGTWSCPSLTMLHDGGVLLAPGHHRLEVTIAEGEVHSVEFEVVEL